MKCQRLLILAVSSLCSMNACSQTQEPNVISIEKADSIPSAVEIPSGAKALSATYPDFIKGYSDGSLTLSNGEKIIYDDKTQKSFVEQMDNADIEDMFTQPYDTSVWTPSRNYDPGRIRNEKLLKFMYGKTSQEVSRNLVKVIWFNQQLPFTKVNGAADSLRAVEKELASLPEKYHKYFYQSSTYNWRKVRGSDRLSAHSYGIAIDICTKYSDFWRWKNPGKEEMDEIVYANRIPKEIIRIFEKHGFISGARWYHYDTMHFEFRPDLIHHSRMTQKKK